MKTTIDLADDLLIAAKKRAAEQRRPMRQLVESGLRRELSAGSQRPARSRPGIRWVTVRGGLPPGLELSDRAAMTEWLSRSR